jgi:hypothetical protein
MKRRISIEIETDDNDARRCGYCEFPQRNEASGGRFCLAFQNDYRLPDLERDESGLLLRCPACLAADVTDEPMPDTVRAPSYEPDPTESEE